MYNYMDALKNDIKFYISYLKKNEGIDVLKSGDLRRIQAGIYVVAYGNEYVTGNISGSFVPYHDFTDKVFYKWIVENMDILKKAIKHFKINYSTIGEYFFKEEWAYFDVIIRQYLLPQAIDEVLKDIGLEA